MVARHGRAVRAHERQRRRHPLGATGAKLAATLVHELQRRAARYGVIAICEGGGMANATLLERVDAGSF